MNRKEVEKQIQAGVDHALPILQSIQDIIQLHNPPRITLVALFKTRKSNLAYVFRKTKILVAGRRFGISALQCGSKFSDIINITT